jgi:hypothetical protein
LQQEASKERSGWRDLELSKRHRQWGWDCPAVDLDFVEFHNGVPVALVEYKHDWAQIAHSSDLKVKALIHLGNNSKIPVFGVRYNSEFTIWKPTPLNSYARFYLSTVKTMSEFDFVSLLYKIRGVKLPIEIANKLNH